MMATAPLLFWDMECVKNSKKLDPKSKEYEQWKYTKRDRETEEYLPDDKLSELYDKTAALNPIFGKVVCISVGMILPNNTAKIRAFTGEETGIIQDFFKVTGSKSINRLVGFNTTKFDSPYISKRALINGIKIPDPISTYGKKPWDLENVHLDLMDVWKGHSFYSDSLSNIAYALGLPNPKDDLKGSEVSDLYWKNPKKNIEKIADYCNGDVLTTINIFLTLQGKGIIQNVIN